MAGVHRQHRIEERLTRPAQPAAWCCGPFPCPGIAVWFPSRCAGTSPLDELTFGPLPPLRCDPVPPARSSPRSPAVPEAGPLEIPETANP